MTDRKVEKLLLSEAEDIVLSNREKILFECGVRKSGGISIKPVLSGVFAAVFLIAFAVICYIPVYYKNHGFTPSDPSKISGGENDENTFETMPEAAEGVPFESIKSGSAEGLVTLYTNKEAHHPYVNLSHRYTRGADGKNVIDYYESDPRENYGYYTYGTDLSFKNNVSDRKMTVLNVSVLQNGDDVVNGVRSIGRLNEYLKKAVDGYYTVWIEVTWDNINLKNEGEYFDVYFVRLFMRVGEHDLFKAVKEFDLDTTEKSDELKLALPLDNEKHYENVRRYESGGEEGSGFGIYSYFDGNKKEQVCLLDEKYALMFDSDTDAGVNPISKIIYAEGPSGPVLFYIENTDIKYEGQSCKKYAVYVYYLTERKRAVLAEIGPFAYSSGTWDINAGIAYYEGSHDIKVRISGTDHSRPGQAVINFNKQEEIVFNGGGYELSEQPYPEGGGIPQGG